MYIVVVLYNYNNYEYDFIPVMFDLATGDTLKIYEDFNSGVSVILLIKIILLIRLHLRLVK